jgi:hypothetical protein
LGTLSAVSFFQFFIDGSLTIYSNAPKKKIEE